MRRCGPAESRHTSSTRRPRWRVRLTRPSARVATATTGSTATASSTPTRQSPASRRAQVSRASSEEEGPGNLPFLLLLEGEDLECPSEGRAVVRRLAVRDHHVFEGKLEKCPERGKRPLLVPG